MIPSIILFLYHRSGAHDGWSRDNGSIFSRWNLALLIRRLAVLSGVGLPTNWAFLGVIALITRLGRSPARERRSITSVRGIRVISVIISISAVPEISSSRSRYFSIRSVARNARPSASSEIRDTIGVSWPCRVSTYTLLIHYAFPFLSRRCLFYSIIIANVRLSRQWWEMPGRLQSRTVHDGH